MSSLPVLHPLTQNPVDDEHQQELTKNRSEQSKLEHDLNEIYHKLKQLNIQSTITKDHIQLSLLRKKRAELELCSTNLLNRIELLKKRECKTWKKIAELNRIESMITRSQQRHQEELSLRHKIEESRKVNGDSLQYKCKLIKSLSSTTIKIHKDLQLKKKQENYLKMKENAQKALKIKASLSKELLAENQKKKKAIDTVKNNGLLKKKVFEKEKLLKTKRRYEQDLKREKKAIRSIELKIQPISGMEQDWISKLQLSKKLHDKKYEGLENLLKEREQENDVSELSMLNKSKKSESRLSPVKMNPEDNLLSKSISSVTD